MLSDAASRVPMKKEHICSVCQSIYTGYGNNALPVNTGRCCDACNSRVVIPARLSRMARG
jgi:hypothetical protein